MAKLFLDAEGSTLGRLASYAAKQALLGNEVDVLNCEKAIVSGRKEDVIEDYKERRQLNTIKPTKGPFFSKHPERIMKRTIRGMLPDFRQGRGKIAWRKVKCYIGIPDEFKKEKMISLKMKSPDRKMTLQELQEKM